MPPVPGLPTLATRLSLFPPSPTPGPKSTTVQLLPHSATTVTWHAAPYHIGESKGEELQAHCCRLFEMVPPPPAANTHSPRAAVRLLALICAGRPGPSATLVPHTP